MNMFSEVGFLFYFVLFLYEGATKPEIADKESDTDLSERGPQEQINYDHLSSVFGTHKNNRSGMLVNVCGFFPMLKSSNKNL